MSEEPIRPLDSDCCGSGCTTCIFDIYEKQLKEFKMGKYVSDKNINILSELKYSPFLINKIDELTEDIRLYEFQAVTLLKTIDGLCHRGLHVESDFEIVEAPLNLKMGDHVILKGNYAENLNTKLISRPYTPVNNLELNCKGIFQTFIKLYNTGCMSQFLRNLESGDIVYWRGPYNQLTFEPNKFDYVILFGAGTGVVPLYNIAKTLVEDESYECWIKSIFCFTTTQRIILREEINSLKSYWNFDCSIYVSDQQEQSKNVLKFNENIAFNRVNQKNIIELIEPCKGKKTVITTCGPESFNNFICDAVKEYRDVTCDIITL